MPTNNLAAQSYWDNGYKNLELYVSPKNDPVRRWIEAFVPDGLEKSCIEIGAYPGRYLSVLGHMHYRLNGVDLAPGTTVQLPSFLRAAGYQVGEFFQTDATTLKTTKTYDLVCSFGFIEHFNNFRTIILQHTRLVKPGGLLVLTTPNFYGTIQRRLHATLDTENLRKHNILAMDISAWQTTLEAEGFTIIRKEYFGRFDFWTGAVPANAIKRLLIAIVINLKPLLRLLPNSRFWSAYSGIVAEKNLLT